MTGNTLSPQTHARASKQAEPQIIRQRSPRPTTRESGAKGVSQGITATTDEDHRAADRGTTRRHQASNGTTDHKPQPPQSSPRPTTSKAGRRTERDQDRHENRTKPRWGEARRATRRGRGGEDEPQGGKKRKADTDGMTRHRHAIAEARADGQAGDDEATEPDG